MDLFLRKYLTVTIFAKTQTKMLDMILNTPLAEIKTNCSIYVFLQSFEVSRTVHIQMNHCTKNVSFPFRISSANVTKSAGNCELSHFLKKSLIENFIFLCSECFWMPIQKIYFIWQTLLKFLVFQIFLQKCLCSLIKYSVLHSSVLIY